MTTTSWKGGILNAAHMLYRLHRLLLGVGKCQEAGDFLGITIRVLLLTVREHTTHPRPDNVGPMSAPQAQGRRGPINTAR